MRFSCWNMCAAGLGFCFFLQSVHGLDAQEAKSEELVGVLRPKVSSGMEDLMNRVPAEYRSLMAPQMEALAAMFEKQVPRVVQHTWVELLQRNGVAAVEVDADTPDSAKEAAAARHVRWLLSSRAEVKHGPLNGATTRGAGVTGSDAEAKVKLEIGLQYAMSDLEGHNALLPQQSTFSGVIVHDKPSDDVWAAAGNGMAKQVMTVLPLGTVRRGATLVSRPKMPEMAQSVRFDIVQTESLSAGGKMRPADPGGEGRAQILEFAGDAMTMEFQGMGGIYSPGDPVIFVIDDKTRTYSTMQPSDFAMITAYASQVARGGKTPRLVRKGEEGRTVHYRVDQVGEQRTPQSTEALQSSPMFLKVPKRYRDRILGTTTEQETTVDIEYAEPLPAWQSGRIAMKELARLDMYPIDLGHDAAISEAVWRELLESPGPPVHISVRETTFTRYKDKSDKGVQSVEVTFARVNVAKLVDFTIPGDYRWHTNPMLTDLFVQSDLH